MAATARGEGGTVSCAASESSSADKRVTNGGGSQRTLAAAGRERELSKILVLRQDNPALRPGSGDHVAICQPRLFFGNRCNVVTGLPQRSNHGEVAALIGEESHWSFP